MDGTKIMSGCEDLLEFFEFEAAGELSETFTCQPFGEVNPQDVFQQTRNLAEGNRVEDLFGDGLGGPVTAAKDNVVALHGGTVHLDFHALQTNVAHVML